VTETRRADRDEVEELGQLMSRAFQDDPLFVHMVPDRAERERLGYANFEPVVRLAMQTGEVWRHGGSVACWQPPGKHDPTEQEVRASGLDQVSSVLGEAAVGRLSAVFATLDERGAANHVPDHWYLALLGTEPEHKGKGHGAAVLRPVLERAAAQGVPCYLETMAERNVAFYSRQGFALLESGVDPGSSLPYWLFLKP
jgi:GNAT superfamily N-acetyltransferase